MKLSQKEIKKVLNKKMGQMNDIIADVDELLTEMEKDFYRVSIFGSARIKEGSKEFDQAYKLAYELASRGVDIVTGGGPGLMQAANQGGKEGSVNSKSFGLHVDLPFEANPNAHVDVKKHHRRFSSRLDEFMRISHAVIVTPGGIGTVLELFYTWQLIQVKHINPRPIILLGGDQMWPELIQWFKKWPLKMKLMSDSDFDNIYFCKDITEVLDKLQPSMDDFYKKV